jgi:hypothetical protein
MISNLTALERGGDTSAAFKDFHLKARARNWSSQDQNPVLTDVYVPSSLDSGPWTLTPEFNVSLNLTLPECDLI